MSDIITKLQAIFAHTETTEGTADGGFPAAADAILAMNLKAREVPRNFHSRSFLGNMGTQNGKIGAIGPVPIQFDTELYGNASNTVPQISALLKSVFGTLQTDSFAGSIDNSATSTSTSLVYDTGSGTYKKGNALLVETGSGTGIYEMCWITSADGGSSSGTITVAPALSFTPAHSATIKFTTTYKLADTGHPSLSIYNFVTNGTSSNAQEVQYLGARGNVKMSAPKAGDIPTLAWDLKAWNWAQATNGSLPTASFGGGIPPIALSTLFKIGGTTTDVFGVEWDLGNVVTPKQSQNSSLGIYGMPVTDRKTTGKFRVYGAAASVAQFTGWTANTTTTLSQQFGNTRFGTWGWYVPVAERTVVAYGDDAGVTSNDVTFNANITSGADAIYLAVG